MLRGRALSTWMNRGPASRDKSAPGPGLFVQIGRGRLARGKW